MNVLNLEALVNETANLKANDFIEVVDEATSLLNKEDGARLGNLTVTGRLVELQPIGEALIIGDLHGDQVSLLTILRTSHFIEKMSQTGNATTIFLGDYGDRGDKSVETYYTVLKLKIAFPQQVILLRGNHEAPQEIMAVPHDLPSRISAPFSREMHSFTIKRAPCGAAFTMPFTCLERYLMLHGGLTSKVGRLMDIALTAENRDEDLLENLLWNDPDENAQGTASSPRGAPGRALR